MLYLHNDGALTCQRRSAETLVTQYFAIQLHGFEFLVANPVARSEFLSNDAQATSSCFSPFSAGRGGERVFFAMP